MGWASDFRSTLRTLRASRGNALAAVVTLALGTGANTAVLAVAYGVLLRPLPFAAPDRLMVIDTVGRQLASQANFGTPLAEVDEWRRRLTDVANLAAFTADDLTVQGLGEPTSVHALLVTGDLFGVLGTPAAVGQSFTDSRATTVVMSDRYAQRLGSVIGTLGRRVTVEGMEFQIGAVMPPAFAFPNDDAEMWVPASSVPDQPVFGQDHRMYRLLARLRPGVPIERLRQEAQHVLRDLHPDRTQTVATVDPLTDVVAGDARPVVGAFVAASGLLLLVACANVAMLLFGRSAARTRELAVRLALGASPARLVRSALLESVVLAGAGSALGVILAEVSLGLFTHSASSSLPSARAITLDWPVLAATLFVGLLVALASGLAPAIAASRTDCAPAFRQTGASPSSSGASRLRALLVVLQVAAAIMLLVGAGLFARTVLSLLRGHGGVAPDHVLTSRLLLTDSTRFDAQGRNTFVATLLARVRALPGVTAAGVGSDLPPRHHQLELVVRMINEDVGYSHTYMTDLVAVTPGYLEALGVRLEQGRFFDEHDDQSAAAVTILSESAARDLSWNRNPLDADFGVGLPTAAHQRVRPRVVGIVSDVHYTGLEASARDNVYVLWPNLPTGTCYLVARTTGDASAAAMTLMRTTHDVDPALPLFDVRSLDDEMNLAIAGRKLRLWLVAAFAGLALAVALVGLSAALARSVTERRRELAIRSALGATPGAVMASVGRHGGALVAAGLAIGLGAAAAAGRWVASLLSGINPYDPTTYAAVAAIALVSAAVACYLPARRASNVDPLEVLRSE